MTRRQRTAERIAIHAALSFALGCLVTSSLLAADPTDSPSPPPRVRLRADSTREKPGLDLVRGSQEEPSAVSKSAGSKAPPGATSERIVSGSPVNPQKQASIRERLALRVQGYSPDSGDSAFRYLRRERSWRAVGGLFDVTAPLPPRLEATMTVQEEVNPGLVARPRAFLDPTIAPVGWRVF